MYDHNALANMTFPLKCFRSQKYYFKITQNYYCTQFEVVSTNDIFFNFLMLHHWLVAQKGFNIKLGNVLTIDLNSKNATKLK
jgi:hypothetical protein